MSDQNRYNPGEDALRIDQEMREKRAKLDAAPAKPATAQQEGPNLPSVADTEAEIERLENRIYELRMYLGPPVTYWMIERSSPAVWLENFTLGGADSWTSAASKAYHYETEQEAKDAITAFRLEGWYPDLRCTEHMDMSNPAPAPAVSGLAEELEQITKAIQLRWDDWIQDTGCFPSDFRWEGGNGKLWFEAGEWAKSIAEDAVRIALRSHMKELEHEREMVPATYRQAMEAKVAAADKAAEVARGLLFDEKKAHQRASERAAEAESEKRGIIEQCAKVCDEQSAMRSRSKVYSESETILASTVAASCAEEIRALGTDSGLSELDEQNLRKDLSSLPIAKFEGDERSDFQKECSDVDSLLRHLGLDPEQYRTECGWLNLSKIFNALAALRSQPAGGGEPK